MGVGGQRFHMGVRKVITNKRGQAKPDILPDPTSHSTLHVADVTCLCVVAISHSVVLRNQARGEPKGTPTGVCTECRPRKG